MLLCACEMTLVLTCSKKNRTFVYARSTGTKKKDNTYVIPILLYVLIIIIIGHQMRRWWCPAIQCQEKWNHPSVHPVVPRVSSLRFTMLCAWHFILTTNENHTQYTSSTPAYTTSRNLGVITFQSRVLTESFTFIPNTNTNYTLTPFIFLLYYIYDLRP